MKQLSILLLLTITTLCASAQNQQGAFDFSVVFIGAFNNDQVSLSINEEKLINSYTIQNTDSTTKGNLSFTQYGNSLEIFYNGQKLTKTAVPVDFVLNMRISINNNLKKMKVDLRKGKVILVDYQTTQKKLFSKKTIVIEQVQEPLIFM